VRGNEAQYLQCTAISAEASRTKVVIVIVANMTFKLKKGAESSTLTRAPPPKSAWLHRRQAAQVVFSLIERSSAGLQRASSEPDGAT
jgi:hypothetical protein